ncbi:MAG TPA: D-alanyl-D-alanine carboxypeptidase family protein [Acetobacteraceae bacterium]|nr:D-alanyl-D-alanine carboxypeptidase family protein [Acetobacteraceae bacterium]
MITIRAASGAAAARVLAGAFVVAAFLGFAAGPARAQLGGGDRYAAILLDHRTGQTLFAANADESRYPASLTKMMTLYMLFEALREGRVDLSTRILMSEEAASRPPSKLGLPAGASLSVEQAILALITKSANDVAVAVAEHLGGSESRFAQMMTLRARSLGMTRTTFRNASGLPDWEQTTTARDMALLGRRLIQDFPNRYHYFSTQYAQVGRIRLRNHNRMLETYDGVDGIKTGYIRDSGFNIVTSAQREGIRLVGAVFGGRSWVERDQHMAMLLDQGFERLGVASRGAPAVAAAGLGLLGSARAATAARAPVTRRTRTALGRPAQTRQVVLAAPQRRPARAGRATPVRIEQGSRAASSRTPARATRAATVTPRARRS